MWRIAFAAIAYVLMAAHVMFHGLGVMVSLSALIPIVLLPIRNRTVVIGHEVLLTMAGFEWIRTTVQLVHVRLAYGADWMLAAAILSACALFSFFSAWMLWRMLRLSEKTA